MDKRAGRGQHVLVVSVVDSLFGSTTTSTVEVTVIHVEEETIATSGSIRIAGW